MFKFFKRKTNDTVDYAKKVLSTDDINKNAEEIRHNISVLINPKKNAKQETFFEARTRLNINDIDLINIYKNYVYSFYVSFGFFIFIFCLILKFLFIDYNVLNGMVGLAALMVCLANSFRFSFRAFQIKHQKLCTVNDWWQRSSEWFPKINN